MDLPFPDRLYMRPSISGPVLLFSDIDSDSRVTSGPVPVWLEVLITLRDHRGAAALRARQTSDPQITHFPCILLTLLRLVLRVRHPLPPPLAGRPVDVHLKIKSQTPGPRRPLTPIRERVLTFLGRGGGGPTPPRAF